jgi:hypothetical protein
MLTRNAWRDVGLRTGAQVVEVEILCTDLDEHRRRIETRASETPGLILPDWQAVIGRDYQPWDRGRVTIDTAGRGIAACLELVLAALALGSRCLDGLLKSGPIVVIKLTTLCARWDF